MSDLLAAFLRASLREPFVWGERDCALWAANWILERRGIDPAASLRGRYGTALGCARIAKAHGGIAGHAASLLDAAGFAETTDPKPGDVGVIETPVGQAVVIRTERGWAWKAKHGLSIVQATHVAAWSI